MGRVTTKFWSLVRRKVATVDIITPSPLSQQTQSAFLSVLPFEMRALIYDFVYCDLYIHLTDFGIHLAHIVHKDPIVLGNNTGTMTESHSLSHQDMERSKDQLLALSLSCQIM